MKTVNIIGAGIAGLSAGCYLQMNGYKTRIFESHNAPGGLCTSWKRADYTFDGCIHWLVGANPKSKFHRLWSELINMDNITFHHHAEYMRVYDAEGKHIALYTDVDKLEKELLEKATDDVDFIIPLIKSIRKISRFEMDPSKATELMHFWDGITMGMKMLPYLSHFRKWNKRTRDIAAELKTPLLKKTIMNTFDPDMAFIFMVFTLAWMNKKDAAYPLGGSLMFSKEIEKRYRELGGEIFYRYPVEKIIATKINSHNRATGIVTDKGEEYVADITISAADGHDTIFRMLEGRFIDEQIEAYYKDYLPFPSYLQISFGLGKKFEGIPQNQMIPLKNPIKLDPETEIHDLPLRFLNYDPNLAPEGKSVLSMMLTTRNDQYWSRLRKREHKKYIAEKKRIASRIIEGMEAHFEGIGKHIEETDISTPATVIRYTNNWKGSFEGWVLTPEIGFKSMKKTLPGLDNFYMIGQWVEPGGGLPTVLRSGRNVAQIICKKDKKKFKTLQAKTATPAV